MSRIAVPAVLVVLGVAGLIAQQPKPAFEVASVRAQTTPLPFPPLPSTSPRVRPGGLFAGTHASVVSLMMFAYGLEDYQISGGPDWVSERNLLQRTALHDLRLAYLYPGDIRRMLAEAGFDRVTIRGGFDGRPFTDDRDELVVEATRGE